MSFLSVRSRYLLRALQYALILVAVALLAATQAAVTPGFIYQNF